MPIQRSQLTKLAFTARIPAHTDADNFLVGIFVNDPEAALPDEFLMLPHPDRIRHPNHFYGSVRVVDMKAVNDHPNVRDLIFARKDGPIAFSEDQIFAAYKQGLMEFNIMDKKEPWLSESREDFKQRDPIGYDETMGAYERILYRALDYI